MWSIRPRCRAYRSRDILRHHARPRRNLRKACVERYGGNLGNLSVTVFSSLSVFPRRTKTTPNARPGPSNDLKTLNEETFETRELVPLRLKVRIAVNTGQVVIGPLDGSARRVGTSAVVAARLQNIAPSNAIVIGSTT